METCDGGVDADESLVQVFTIDNALCLYGITSVPIHYYRKHNNT